MRILIVLPDARIHKLRLGPLQTSFREAPLTATFLAALVPANLNADVSICDESVDTIPFHRRFDLVGVSAITGTAPRAYEIAARFRRAGATVVLGGPHVMVRPDEAMAHADAVVVGFAETAWPRLLHDFRDGKLRRVYHGTPGGIDDIPLPRRDLQKRFGYMSPFTAFATRGCKGSCEFCTVPAAGFGWHTRPVAAVVDEIRKGGAKRVVFNDVNITEDADYAKALFRALIPLNIRWGGLASTRIAEDGELLDLMAESGCIFILTGFESANPVSLRKIHKGFNNVRHYRTFMDRCRDRRIVVQGCFIFGFDEDDAETIDRTLEMIDDLRIDIPRLAVFTPYPGTPAFRRLRAEGRLLHQRWEYYDTQHVVFRPKRMTPEELDHAFRNAVRKTYSIHSNLKRTIGSGRNLPIAFLGNLAYKLYAHRLRHDRDRFPG